MHAVQMYVGRYWEMVERLKLTHFYTSPTAIRLLLKAGNEWVERHDTSSLRILGCGKPRGLKDYWKTTFRYVVVAFLSFSW